MKNKFITLLLFVSLITPSLSYAQNPLSISFGGRIVGVNECFCSGGWMIWVYDVATKVTLPLVFQFGLSKLNMAYNIITPGVQTLGTYSAGGICLMASLECSAGPIPIGTITPLPGIGTSLIPFF